MKLRIQDFCKESVLWMHTSHPNVLELIAVNINPQTGALSMISELMDNGNIMDYIRLKEANRIRLVRHLCVRPFCKLTIQKLGDVAKGLLYLHKCGVIHGDLKGVRWHERGLNVLT